MTMPDTTIARHVNGYTLKGYFIKLSNGNYGLAKTYWLHGVYMLLLVNIGVNTTMKPITPVWFCVALMLVYTAYQVSIFIGIWKAANEYEGLDIFATLAKYSIIPFVVVLVVNLASIARL